MAHGHPRAGVTGGASQGTAEWFLIGASPAAAQRSPFRNCNSHWYRAHSSADGEGVSFTTVLRAWGVDTHEEGAQHVEADEVEDSEARSTGVLLSRQEVRVGVTQLPVHAGQHDLLPGLACRTPAQHKAGSGTAPALRGYSSPGLCSNQVV